MSRVGSPMTPTSTPTTTPISTPVMTNCKCKLGRSSENNNICNYNNYSPSTSDTCSHGAAAYPNCASSSCSSQSKDRERAIHQRHESMWCGTTHSNIAQEKSGWADGAKTKQHQKSERMSYITPPFSLPSPLSVQCSPSLHAPPSLSAPLPHSPPYTTYAKGDDTVYSRGGGSHVDSR